MKTTAALKFEPAPREGKIILVTGGARSGKSRFAEQYAAKYGKKIAYIATAQIYDEEMSRRVRLHQQRRPGAWRTYEAPYDADKAIEQAAQTADFLLFDCLTLYISNLLCAADAPAAPDERQSQLEDKLRSLIAAVKGSGITAVFVTNEVGMSIVPENAMAREYRDLAGLANQQMAAAADEVYLTVCGLAVNIKKIAENLEV